MTRKEAIDVLKEYRTIVMNCLTAKTPAFDMAIEVLTHEIRTETHGVCSDLISRAEAIKAIRKCEFESDMPSDWYRGMECAQGIVDDVPSAEAVQGWRTDKPTEQGEYIVTVDSMRHGMVELMYYGKPLMPNRKVRGKCWYRSDDEWGDVVYDDADILAWMPLPKPYKENDEDYELATEQMEHDAKYEPTYNTEDGSM